MGACTVQHGGAGEFGLGRQLYGDVFILIRPLDDLFSATNQRTQYPSARDFLLDQARRSLLWFCARYGHHVCLTGYRGRRGTLIDCSQVTLTDPLVRIVVDEA